MEVNQKKKNKDMAGREAFEIKEETQKGRVLSWQASEWKGETGEKKESVFCIGTQKATQVNRHSCSSWDYKSIEFLGE